MSATAFDFPGFVLSAEFLRDDEDWDDTRYPFNLPAFRGLDELELHPQVTFVVGENGSGKSTLIEALAVALGLNPEGGGRDHRFRNQDTHSDLHYFLRIARTPRRPTQMFFLRAESFYQFSTYIDQAGTGRWTGGQALHSLSHGQGFMALFQHGLAEKSFYILDEPEAALSPNRQLAFLSILHDLVRGQCQFVIATHSPIILAYPHATIYHLSDRGLERAAYEDLEHFQVTRNFLNRRETFLKVLLED